MYHISTVFLLFFTKLCHSKYLEGEIHTNDVIIISF